MMDDLAPLETEIRRRIAAAGPMPVAEYMALCLTDPEHGYYTTRDPVGLHGDFITAPEVSQMFGELIGLWMAAVWRQMGSPTSIRIVELGPGHGTMMRDALRAARLVPEFGDALTLHLVEINRALMARQESTLGHLPVPMSWHPALTDVPAGPAIIVANEFFDALPVHQAVKRGDRWYERQVGIDDDGNLGFTASPIPLPGFGVLLPALVRDASDGSIFEWRDNAMAFDLGRRIATQGGAALVIDYGHGRSDVGDTLQAVGGHAYTDPLTAPGGVDLTAHVDFQALIHAVEAMGAVGYGPMTQSHLLLRLGIESRAVTLKSRATPAQAADVNAALTRLTGEGRSDMGGLFKAVAFTHRSLGVPPAFER